MRFLLAAGSIAIVLSFCGAAIFGIVAGCMTYQNGIYAGYHYQDAANVATKALVHQYGSNLVQQFKYKGELKTHFGGIGRQVRIFRFVGPRGVRYCVTVWTHSSDSNHWQVEKGCTF